MTDADMIETMKLAIDSATSRIIGPNHLHDMATAAPSIRIGDLRRARAALEKSNG